MSRVSDKLDLSGGSMIRPTKSVRVHFAANLASGATATIDLTVDGDNVDSPWTEPPDAYKIVGAYVESEVAVSSGNGGTTGATAVVGIAGTTNGILTSATVFNLTAGAKSDLAGPGTLVNRLRTATTLILTLTATGGGPDVAHLTGSFWVHFEVVQCHDRV